MQSLRHTRQLDCTHMHHTLMRHTQMRQTQIRHTQMHHMQVRHTQLGNIPFDLSQNLTKSKH